MKKGRPGWGFRIFMMLWWLLNGWLRFFADTDLSVRMKKFADTSWILFGVIFCIWIIADSLGNARKRKSKKMRICDFVCFSMRITVYI